MSRSVISLFAGALFGAGLSISQMIDPARVVGFLDVAGRWDPTLAFVMGAALLVTGVAFRAILRRPAPILAAKFHLPERTEIDGPLVAGSAFFGVGWGISGLCPGPALASLAWGFVPSIAFVVAMVGGMMLFEVRSRWISSILPQGTIERRRAA